MRTFQQTIDNISAHQINADVACRRAIIREVPTASHLVDVWGVTGSAVKAGSSVVQDTNPYRVFQGEIIDVKARDNGKIEKNEALCFLQPVGGTITIAIFYED